MKLQDFYQTILLESSNIKSMFDDVIKLYDEAGFDSQNIKKQIKSELKRTKEYMWGDGVVWMARLIKAVYLNKLYMNLIFAPNKSTSKQLKIEIERKLNKIHQKQNIKFVTEHTRLEDIHNMFEHFSTLDYQPIKNYRFKDKDIYKAFNELSELENKYLLLKKRSDGQTEEDMLNDGAKPFLKINNSIIWWDLGKSYCPKEADMMNHCGNKSQENNPNITILSLREKKKRKEDGVEVWVPLLTFIYNKADKSLGEMKGFKNQKPSKKYHKYIIELLKHPMIKKIKGGGFLPENNFSLQDLSNSDIKELYKKKPELFSTYMKILLNIQKNLDLPVSLSGNNLSKIFTDIDIPSMFAHKSGYVNIILSTYMSIMDDYKKFLENNITTSVYLDYLEASDVINAETNIKLNKYVKENSYQKVANIIYKHTKTLPKLVANALQNLLTDIKEYYEKANLSVDFNLEPHKFSVKFSISENQFMDFLKKYIPQNYHFKENAYHEQEDLRDLYYTAFYNATKNLDPTTMLTPPPETSDLFEQSIDDKKKLRQDLETLLEQED